MIEPRRLMLRVPDDNVRLFKVMPLGRFLESVRDGYLYFRRVDCYSGFADADPDDGRQLPSDVAGNRASPFLRSPDFTAADLYDASRSRSYACCFTTSDAAQVMTAYGSGDGDGKVRVSFLYGRLMDRVRHALATEDAEWRFGGARLPQIFDLDAGFVEYVDRKTHRENSERLANPITYIFTKDMEYAWESEVRLSLSMIGTGQFQVGGRPLEFPCGIRLLYDFKTAMRDGEIVQVELCSTLSDATLQSRFSEAGIGFNRTD